MVLYGVRGNPKCPLYSSVIKEGVVSNWGLPGWFSAMRPVASTPREVVLAPAGVPRGGVTAS